MEKAKLYKIALFTVSAILIFGCQAKASDTKKFTQEEMKQYYLQLPPEMRKDFDQMTDKEKTAAMQKTKIERQKKQKLMKVASSERERHKKKPKEQSPISKEMDKIKKGLQKIKKPETGKFFDKKE